MTGIPGLRPFSPAASLVQITLSIDDVPDSHPLSLPLSYCRSPYLAAVNTNITISSPFQQSRNPYSCSLWILEDPPPPVLD